MMSLQIGDIVWVPFPHVETNRVRSRPALIVSIAKLGPAKTLVWALMITSADNASWAGDIELSDHLSLELPVPSSIRTEKIVTLDISEARFLSRLPQPLMDRVRLAMHGYMAVQ